MEISLGHALVSVSDNSTEKLVGYLASAIAIEPVAVRMKHNPPLGSGIPVDLDCIKRRIEAPQDNLVREGSPAVRRRKANRRDPYRGFLR
jgi:hypothetical protein